MRTRHTRVLTALLLLMAISSSANAASFEVDTAHTTVGFSVRHLFTSVQGRFDEFQGKIEFDPVNPAVTKVEGTVRAASINTSNAKRDDHLRSADFFEVEKFPELKFASTGVKNVDAAARTGKLEGILTIRDQARPVVLDVAFLGQGKDPWGNAKAGFTATTTINRKDFGLAWNETLETGGVLVGEDVTITIHVEGNLVE